MRFLSTRVHAVLDYLMGALLIVAPWLLGFARGGAETWVPVILGLGIIFYSLMTNYEYSVGKAISMPAHLWLDAMGGIFLAISPWLFGFAEYIWVPHFVLGILEVGAALFTQTVPSHGAVPERRHPAAHGVSEGRPSRP